MLVFSTHSAVADAPDPVAAHNPRHEVTVDYLLESCTVIGQTAGGLIPYFDCESYIQGVLDGYALTRGSIPPAVRACFPAAMPAWQALADMRAAPLDNVRDHPAGAVMLDVLRKKYPCT